MYFFSFDLCMTVIRSVTPTERKNDLNILQGAVVSRSTVDYDPFDIRCQHYELMKSH